MSLSDAINDLSADKKKVYKECKKRGLIDTDGYSLKK